MERRGGNYLFSGFMHVPWAIYFFVDCTDGLLFHHTLIFVPLAPITDHVLRDHAMAGEHVDVVDAMPSRDTRAFFRSRRPASRCDTCVLRVEQSPSIFASPVHLVENRARLRASKGSMRRAGVYALCVLALHWSRTVGAAAESAAVLPPTHLTGVLGEHHKASGGSERPSLEIASQGMVPTMIYSEYSSGA